MENIAEAHKKEYQAECEVAAEAPGRFHLIGEHSWFFKDKTLSMAVNLPVQVALSRRSDSTLKCFFDKPNESKRFQLSALKFKKEDKWANAIKSVVFGWQSLGREISGLNVTVSSDAMPSVGFGITTAIKVATSLAIQKLFAPSESRAPVLRAIEIGNKNFLMGENHRADNFAAMFSKRGKLVLTDHSTNKFELVDFPFDDMRVMLVDAKVPRISVWDEESVRQPENALMLGELREMKKDTLGGWQYIDDVTEINETLSVLSASAKRKMQSVINEHRDVIEACEGLSKNDFARFARAVNHSHENMRDLYEISCPEIDWIVKRVNELEPALKSPRLPVTCARITGKGFGRCLYAFIRSKDEGAFMSRLAEYERLFAFKPSCREVKPADGARIIKG